MRFRRSGRVLLFRIYKLYENILSSLLFLSSYSQISDGLEVYALSSLRPISSSSSFFNLHFGRGLRGTVIFGLCFYTCPDYLRLSAQYLRFQPAFLLGFASLVFGLPRSAYKTVEVFRVLFLH